MIGATEAGGLSNSHLRVRNDPPSASAVLEAGIDTWRLVRYLNDAETDSVARVCTQRVRRGYLHPDAIAGHRVGVLPSHRMLFIEGHPAVEGLAPLMSLAKAEQRVLQEIGADLPIGKDGGVARLDQTVTLRFADRFKGMAFLSGMAAVDVPRTKPAVYGRPVETVYLLGEMSGRPLARVYDKGVESNSAPRGELIRLENQSRWSKEGRRTVGTFDEVPAFASNKFSLRFAPVAESLHGVTAATMPVIAEKLGELLHDGEITARQAERLAGYLIVGQRSSKAYSVSTRKRRRRELRQHGLVLTDPLAEPVEVDLGEPLEQALAAWSRDAEAG